MVKGQMTKKDRIQRKTSTGQGEEADEILHHHTEAESEAELEIFIYARRTNMYVLRTAIRSSPASRSCRRVWMRPVLAL